MSKLAIVATIKTVPGKREEYLTFLKAHGKRCLATEPGTLQFEILVPQEEADTLMLYEVYASPEAFQTHWNGTSIQQMKQEAAALQTSLTGVRLNERLIADLGRRTLSQCDCRKADSGENH